MLILPMLFRAFRPPGSEGIDENDGALKLSLIAASFAARNPAGLKTHDSPLTVPIAINPRIPEPSADIAIAILPHHIGLRRDHGGVPVNPYLNSLRSSCVMCRAPLRRRVSSSAFVSRVPLALIPR